MRLFPKVEHIGPPQCPILNRWTLLNTRGWKVMVHHFLPNTEDRPLHDHPWSFFTFVLWGSYEDIGYSTEEVVQAPTVRYRPAMHLHRTRTGKHGAWTLVISTPKSRDWGFFHNGRWWPFKTYERVFGFRSRCD